MPTYIQEILAYGLYYLLQENKSAVETNNKKEPIASTSKDILNENYFMYINMSKICNY